MGSALKLAACALLTAVLVLTVRKHNDSIALVLALASCCICGILICDLASPVFSFLDRTAQTAGIDSALLSPLLKTVGVGFLTQFSSDICADAGQTALARVVQTGGTVLCICVSLPLFTAVLALIQTVSGG